MRIPITRISAVSVSLIIIILTAICNLRMDLPLLRLDWELMWLKVKRHSVYSAENKTIYPGIDKAGPRIINFADILKYDYIPLAKSLTEILDIVKEALGAPVEIEFAVDLTKDKDYKASFYLLQIKPIIGASLDYEVNMDEIDKSHILLYTEKSMGNGMINNIRDVIYVDRDNFDKSKTVEIAAEIDAFNDEMIRSRKQYILLGPGWWGSS